MTAGPAWLSQTLAAMMLAIGAYCAVRLAVAGGRRRETELDSDVTHLLMGVAMAGMLTPALGVAPAAAWTAVFAAAAAWFAWQAVRAARGRGTGRWRCPYPVPHLAECLAMVYMLVAVRGAGGAGPAAGPAAAMGAAGMARAPELAVVFAVFLAGYVAWLGDRFPSAATAAAGGCWPALAPRGACCYKLGMSVVMGYMLIVML